MRNTTHITPGARVRAPEGFLGVVERLETRVAENGDRPDVLIARSDDGRWRYAIPLLLVDGIEGDGAGGQVVRVRIPRDQLTYYVMERLDGAATTPPGAAGATPAREGDAVVPLAVEDMVIRKEPVLWGQVHIHKDVETNEQRVSLPVFHEEAIIERIPAEAWKGGKEARPDEIVIPLLEERLVVRREVVVREYLRVRRNRVEVPYEVRGALRGEIAEITREGNLSPRPSPLGGERE